VVQVMKGVRILEVAQFTFVPVAAAILADWGADVIKVEHPTRGDTQRGFINLDRVPVDPQRNVMMAHPNRGKRSVGIDVSKPEGQELIYELAKTADIFLTNYLPAQRQKLKIDLEHIRAANPNIIYARGTAHGDKGPDRDKGGFDLPSFWARGGAGMSVAPPELGGPLGMPAPAFGDTIGGTNIALGMAAALFHRAQTGEALEFDVSLLGSGLWASGMGIGISIETQSNPFVARMPGSGGARGNPFVGMYKASDGGYLSLNIMTPGRYLEDTWIHLGIPEMMQDDRFNTAETVMANWEEASRRIAAAVATQPMSYWMERLSTMAGQWAPYQTFLQTGSDAQALANGFIVEVEAHGGPLKLVSSPVQFNHEPIAPGRYPDAGEHTEMVLMENGLEWDKVEELKAKGVIN